MKRLILVLLLLVTPVTALAADDTSLQVTGGGTSSKDNVGTALQPSSTSNLQSTGSSPATGSTGDATGLAAPDSSSLQAAPSSDAVDSYLNGELVGGPQGKADSGSGSTSGASWLDWLATIILAIVVATAGAYYANRQRRSSRRAQLREMPKEAKAETTPLTTEVAKAIVEREDENNEAVAAEVVERAPVKGAGKQAQSKNKNKGKSKSGKKKARKR